MGPSRPRFAANYIAGRWEDPPMVEERPPKCSPIDGVTVLAQVGDASDQQIDETVEAARRRHSNWRTTGPTERSGMLAAMSAALRAHGKDIAEAMVLEVGKSPAEALGEIDVACRQLEFFAASAWRESGRIYPTNRLRTHVYMVREPLGVVAAITPWNFPISLAINKIAPAIAAGNAVVLKPAPEAAETTAAMVASMAGVADGLLGLLQGGSRVGHDLVRHRGVNGVAFTGSTAAGLQVAAAVGSDRKICVCEMGGKNAMVVMDDADLVAAVDAAIESAFRMAGQKCTATSRLLIHATVRDAALSALEAGIKGLIVGDPRRKGVSVGPVINAASRDRIEATLAAAAAAAENAVTVRSPRPGHLPRSGFYVPPALVVDPPASSTLTREEIFGPVLTVETFAELEEAVKRVNDTSYGLVSSIYSASSGIRFLREVACGTVLVNQPTTGFDSHVPFAGWKDSGIGGPEQGDVSVETYSRNKVGYLSW